MKDIIIKLLKPLNSIRNPKIRLLYFAAGIISALMFPVMQMLLSLTQKNLVNAVEYGTSGYMNTVYLFCGLIMILAVIVQPVSFFYMEKAIYSFMREFRTGMMKKLLSLPMPFFDTKHTGDIITRINGDLERCTFVYDYTINRFFIATFYGIGSIAVMAFLNWQLALVLIALAVSETYAMAKISVIIKENTEIIREKTGRINALFFDLEKNLKFIRMSSISNILLGKYRNINKDIVDVSINRNKTVLRMNAVSDFFEAFNLIGVLSVGIVMYFNDFIDLGSVFAFLILQDGVTYMSFYLREVFQQAQQNRVNVQRIFDILDSDIEMDPPSIEKEVVLLPDVDIRCKDLTFRYQELQNLALDNISCRIPPEKVTVITGLSGGGKSTLVKLLLGLYRQEEGNIRIGESDYSQLSLKNIHDHYSYVPQSGHLFHDSIENNIRCGNVDASFEEVIEAAKSAQAHDFIMDKPDGYQTMIQEHGTNFSGGEKQRIAIARAILKNAPVIILDEATSAVDSNTEYRIYDYLRILVENGKTVVIVTHRESASRISDHAIHIG